MAGSDSCRDKNVDWRLAPCLSPDSEILRMKQPSRPSLCQVRFAPSSVAFALSLHRRPQIDQGGAKLERATYCMKFASGLNEAACLGVRGSRQHRLQALVDRKNETRAYRDWRGSVPRQGANANPRYQNRPAHLA